VIYVKLMYVSIMFSILLYASNSRVIFLDSRNTYTARELTVVGNILCFVNSCKYIGHVISPCLLLLMSI